MANIKKGQIWQRRDNPRQLVKITMVQKMVYYIDHGRIFPSEYNCNPSIFVQIYRLPHGLIFSFLMLSAMMLAIETSKNKDK